MITFKSFIFEQTKPPATRIRRVARRIRRNAKGQLVVQRNKRVRGKNMKGFKLVGTSLRRMTAQEIRARSSRNPNRRRGFRKSLTKRAARLRKWRQSLSRRRGW
jgi:hypothetical protein